MSPVEVDEGLLRGWPLPQPQPHADKEERGRVLVVAGSTEMPGAALLASEAALRAGAGKLVLATVEGIAPALAMQLPEARVIALPPGGPGAGPQALEGLRSTLAQCAAVLVGPGMQPEGAACAFAEALLRELPEATPVVLDAAAMGLVRGAGPLRRTAVLTPHAGEMAHLSGARKEDVQQRPAETAAAGSARWGATVVLKGAETWIAAPDGRLWRHAAAQPGLATSGSGDVLAGVMVGLLARGAPPEQAAAWAVALHARAGERLASRHGPLGALAREFAAEVPAVMAGLAAGPST